MPFVVCAPILLHIFILQSASGPHFLPFLCHSPHPQFSLQMSTRVISLEDHLEHSSVLLRGFSRLRMVKTGSDNLASQSKPFPVQSYLDISPFLCNEPSALVNVVSSFLQTALSLPASSLS